MVTIRIGFLLLAPASDFAAGFFVVRARDRPDADDNIISFLDSERRDETRRRPIVPKSNPSNNNPFTTVFRKLDIGLQITQSFSVGEVA